MRSRNILLLATAAAALVLPANGALSSTAGPRDSTGNGSEPAAVVHEHGHDHDHTAMAMPDPHSHAHTHEPPKLVLNETEILRWHAPDPPSYWDHDFGELDGSQAGSRSGWSGFMITHIVAMSMAYFVALPLAIALRGAKHALHGPVNAAFLALTFFGVVSGTAYKKLTPDLYEGSAHGTMGNLLLLVTTLLSIVDSLAVIRRGITFLRTPGKSPRRLWQYVLLGRDEDHHSYGRVDQPELYALQDHIEESESFIRPSSPAAEDDHWHEDGAHSPGRSSDDHSETTLHDLHSTVHHTFPEIAVFNASWATKIARIVFHVVEHSLVVFAFAVTLSGMITYTGICRESYVNGCLAHLIKGGIFLFYGILTFGRYCGAFSQVGWAWNRVATPANRRPPPTAEMVESFVIFLYGATNTWMERFGAQPGDPYTTKQIQHISIAVMFWFAGLTGMALESPFVRRMLSAPALSATGRPESEVAQPPSYRGSFNPFPALVIGITGAAMSAHHQEYEFQVQIHALWGLLLSAFAVFRFLTYFFLWLRPPTSILPSRPPTEALASFTLACGGLTFMLSTEQITFAAMRNGKDDVMMFLNLVVGVICLLFTWILAVLAIRGWAISRTSASMPSKQLMSNA